MRALLNDFFKLNVYVKVIFFFCVYGLLLNLFSVVRDLRSDGILLRLHTGFLLLYAGQVAFIVLKEKWVCVLAALQAILALGTNLDFTFMPALGVVGRIFSWFFSDMTVQGVAVYKYVVVSLAFTLQCWSAYELFMGLGQPKKHASESVAENVSALVEK